MAFDPYSESRPLRVPGSIVEVRYDPHEDGDYLLILPPCDGKVVARRQVFVLVGGSVAVHRVSPRDNMIRLALSANTAFETYIVDVSKSGATSTPGPTTSLTTLGPPVVETSSGQIVVGQDRPPNDTGNDGDLWVDPETGDLYRKQDGTW